MIEIVLAEKLVGFSYIIVGEYHGNYRCLIKNLDNVIKNIKLVSMKTLRTFLIPRKRFVKNCLAQTCMHVYIKTQNQIMYV